MRIFAETITVFLIEQGTIAAVPLYTPALENILCTWNAAQSCFNFRSNIIKKKKLVRSISLFWSKIPSGHSMLSWVLYSWTLTHSSNHKTLFKCIFSKWKMVSRFPCSEYFTVTCQLSRNSNLSLKTSDSSLTIGTSFTWPENP